MEIEDKYRFELDSRDLDWDELKKLYPGIPEPPTTPERWTADVRRTLQRIEENKAGRILLDSIRRYGRWVRIRPYWGPHMVPWTAMARHEYPCNADANGLGGGAYGAKSTLTGNWLSALVRISPERFAAGTPCGEKYQDFAVGEVHEVMFHELVHALRAVTDNLRPLKLAGGVKGDRNFEEFIAVLVTNIYASSNGKIILRASHRDHSALDRRFDTSFEFFRISRLAYPLIFEFCDNNRQFCQMLSTVEARFNPIRAYYEDTNRARALSASALAARRDGPSFVWDMLFPAPS